MSGLQAPVDVRFDSFAIPHIYAVSSADAWEAVGYLQARDRLWQMELYRRAASGRLAEMLGADLLAVDERFLTLGLRHAAEIEWQSATPVVRMAFEEYALGVNAAITAAGRWKRPLELQLLGVRQEPWTPIDSLAIGKLFAWPTEAASYRQILDAGAWDLSVAVNTTGQSGHARSPHYFDQNLLWRSGRYHPLPFTRAAVEAATWGVWN